MGGVLGGAIVATFIVMVIIQVRTRNRRSANLVNPKGEGRGGGIKEDEEPTGYTPINVAGSQPQMEMTENECYATTNDYSDATYAECT